MKPYPAKVYPISPFEVDPVVGSDVFVVDSGPGSVVTDSVSSVVEPSAEKVNMWEMSIKYVTIVETRHGHTICEDCIPCF